MARRWIRSLKTLMKSVKFSRGCEPQNWRSLPQQRGKNKVISQNRVARTGNLCLKMKRKCRHILAKKKFRVPISRCSFFHTIHVISKSEWANWSIQSQPESFIGNDKIITRNAVIYWNLRKNLLSEISVEPHILKFKQWLRIKAYGKFCSNQTEQ